MNKLIMTIGISSSGKSSWAEEFIRKRKDYVEINRDNIRFGLFTNGVRDWTKYKFNNANEKRVTVVQNQLAFDAALNGKNIIVSDTNLNPKIRNQWATWAKNNNYEYEEMLFPITWEVAVKRNAQREGGLSESMLFDMYVRYMRQFGKYDDYKVVEYRENPDLPYCVWVDIDGTVATMNDRSPYQWDKVDTDIPRTEVITMIESLVRSNHNMTVVFMSGRSDICYEKTYQWITKHFLLLADEYVLHMRKEGDQRKDDVVKYEMYLEHIWGKYNVAAVFDDRPSVLRMQRVLNLPNMIQVGDFGREF